MKKETKLLYDMCDMWVMADDKRVNEIIKEYVLQQRKRVYTNVFTNKKKKYYI